MGLYAVKVKEASEKTFLVESDSFFEAKRALRDAFSVGKAVIGADALKYREMETDGRWGVAPVRGEGNAIEVEYGSFLGRDGEIANFEGLYLEDEVEVER